jgi:hypothetical protein
MFDKLKGVETVSWAVEKLLSDPKFFRIGSLPET